MTDSIDYRFQCGDFPDDKFHVVRFTGEEGVSRLYRFQVDLVSDDAEIDVDDLQDQPSTFTIAGGAHERRIQGVAAEVEVLDQVGDRTIYRLTIVPRVWQLGLTRVNAVYLERTTPEVIEGTLEEQLGITSVDYETSLRADYRSWPFRLQYGESYWDYLSRLMERDGIYYYFVAGEDGERIVFCDSAGEQPAIEDPELPHTASLGMSASDDALAHGTIDSLILRQCRQPKTVWVQNYNDDKPSTPIREQAEVDPRGTGDINLYGQNVLDSEEATAIAAIRAEELRCTKAVYHGESTAFRLAPGHRFDLTRHRRPQNNQEYQLVSIEHSGHNPAVTSLIGQVPPAGTPVYENRFTAIPADTQYRPPRTTDWPSIRGTLNAEIDAEGDGRFAELDEEGRYHVVFPFHRGFGDPGREDAGKASHWVRLVQPYSGEREGMHFPLRKGTRVLIGFIGGNPDLPVITGAVPSAEQRSVVQSENQTRGMIRTPGGNEIEADDNSGRERIRLYSANSRTSIRLGADQHHLFPQTSAGAAASTASRSDPDADGSLTETTGVARLAYFGGTNYVIATDGWAVKSTIWYDTRIKRDDHLALNDKNIASLNDYGGGHDEWRVVHGLDRIFPFPRKHPIPEDLSGDPVNEPDADKYLTPQEEAQGRLLITRTLGDEYFYRNGTTFSFQGPDRETFDFGPMATFTSNDPEADQDRLRKTVTEKLEGWEEADRQAYEDLYGELEPLRASVREWQIKRDEREVEKNNLEEEAKDKASARDHGVGYLVFTVDATFREWAHLANVDPDDSAGWVMRDESSGNGEYYLVWPDNMTTFAYAHSKSITHAEKKLTEAKDEYNDKRDEAANLSTNTSDWSDKLRKARITVNEYDSFVWHAGDIYDFGGCWNYNVGNGYEENHVVWTEPLNKTGHDCDLLVIGGPDWTDEDAPWSVRVDGVVKDELNGDNQMLVSKTFGDTYDYHQGAAMDVQVGASLSVKKGGPNVERKYSEAGGEEQLVEHVVATGYTTDTWRNHKISGRPLYYGSEGWGVQGIGFGKTRFSAEYAPSATLDLKGDTSLATTLHAGAMLDVELFIGAKTDIDLSLAANLSISVAAAATIDFNAFAAMKMDLSVGTGFILEVSNYVGVKTEIDVPAMEFKTTAAGAAIENSLDKILIKAAVGSVTTKKVEIESGTLTINSKPLNMNA